MFTIISCVQNTVNHDRHLQCAETIQFSPSCCVQNTDNSHCHVNVCAEHRQFCHVVCAEHKINKPQTILTVMLCVRTQTILIVMLCVQIRSQTIVIVCCVCRTQTILTVMFCVQNTDKQSTDNSHSQEVCAEHRQTERRQFSPPCCVCRTQTNRAQTILTVKLCVQNTDKQNTENSHCHFVRVEHSWAMVWTRPSAVPTTPCGNCSSRTERGTSTVCDTAAYWSVGTDPSRLVWHQDGQRLTQ